MPNCDSAGGLQCPSDDVESLSPASWANISGHARGGTSTEGPYDLVRRGMISFTVKIVAERDCPIAQLLHQCNAFIDWTGISV